MPSYVPPKINTEYIFYISLVSQADTKLMQNSPTIAAGDFQVSTNGGALGNLATLPVVTPAGSDMVKITLSTSEMNGDNVTIVCSDAAGAEWCDLVINIQTSASQQDDLVRSTTPANTLNVDANNRAEALLGAVTHTGAVVPTVTTTTTVSNLTTNNDKTGYSLSATGADLILKTATFALAIADAIWDEVLSSGTHDVADSSGRRVRNLQEFGTYINTTVFIDILNGFAGTTDYENGTFMRPVNSIANANTIATSLSLVKFMVAPGNSLTFAASQDSQEWFGNAWTLALSSQSISGTYIRGASISGICSGASVPEFHKCIIGAVTVPSCVFNECNMEGTITLPAAIVDIQRPSGDSGFTLDYGAAVANTTVNISDFSGELVINNLGQLGTDILNLRGHGKITFSASCVGGIVNWDGHFTIIDNGSGITFNSDDISTNVDTLIADWGDAGRLDVILDAILAMLDDARTEPGQGAPPVNPDLATKIDYLYKYVINKGTNDGSNIIIRDFGDTTDDHKAPVSEAAGTVTKGLFISGA